MKNFFLFYIITIFFISISFSPDILAQNQRSSDYNNQEFSKGLLKDNNFQTESIQSTQYTIKYFYSYEWHAGGRFGLKSILKS